MKSPEVSTTVILALLPAAMLMAWPTVELTKPPPGRYGIEDLWKATVISDTVCDAWFEGWVFEATHGQAFHAMTKPFPLTGGTRVYGYRDVTIDETQTAPGYEAFVARTGQLPQGNYRFKLMLQPFGTGDSFGFEVKPTGPPRLTSPPDGATVTEQYPLFVWTPPMPMPKGRVTYELKLTQVLPGQTAAEAIRANPPWFTQAGLSATSLTYPPSAPTLEDGVQHAWHVAATPGGQSEVRVFAVGSLPRQSLSVASVSPSAVRQGQAVELTVSGRGFADGAAVSFVLAQGFGKEDMEDDCHFWKCPKCGKTWTCYANFCPSCYVHSRGKVKGDKVCEVRQCPVCGKSYRCSYTRCSDDRKTLSMLEGLGIAADSAQFVDAQELRAVIRVSEDAPFVARDVVVTNPDGRQGVLPAGLEVVCAAEPCGGSGLPCSKWQCQKCKRIWECSSNQCPDCKGSGLSCQKWQCQKCKKIWECSSNQCPSEP